MLFILFKLLFLDCAAAAFSQDLYWNGQIKYGNSVIQEDPPQEATALWINPNEQENYLQLRCISPNEKGALISIGGFRVLNLAASNYFNITFQLDFNILVKLFNQLNLELVRISRDRFEYLSLLLTGTFQRALIQEVLDKKITEYTFYKTLITIANKNASSSLSTYQESNLKIEPNYAEGLAYYSLLSELRLNLPTVSNEQLDFLDKKLNVKPLQFSDQKNVLLELLYRKHPTINLDLWYIEDFYRYPSQSAFFRDDTLFSNLKTLISQNRVIVLSADLAGDHTLKDISDALRTARQKVKAMDVSNAHSWIIRSGNPIKIRKYLSNVKNLPWSPQGKLFLTDEPDSLSRWKYFVLAHQVFTNFKDLYWSGAYTRDLKTGDGLSSQVIPDHGRFEVEPTISSSLYSIPAKSCLW